MSSLEELPGCLAKLRDLNFEGCSLYWVTQFVQINSTLIGNRVENIIVLE